MLIATSVGVGGNLPVDSAIFLEFLPRTHQYLLTVLSIFWALAQTIITLIAWPLLGNLTCATGSTCKKSDNMGWRYLVITAGGMALIGFIVRFFVFRIYESPKYLMGKGDDEAAVRVVHELAKRNGTESTLTVDDLKACEAFGQTQATERSAALKRNLEKFSAKHVRALFATKKLAFSTSLIMLVWAFIGLAFPLYNAFLPSILESRAQAFGDTSSVYITYRNSLIIAVLGIPGSILGGVFVELKHVGRKGALCLSTILTGVFILASTTAKNSNALLGFNCAYNFFSTFMYAVLYAYTPEVFPTKDRGTGNALAASANRIFGIMAPIIAIAGNLNTPVPVYTSGGLFVLAGLLVLILPYESRGKASL